MGYKKHLNLSVDADLVELAQKLNLNISSLIEEAILQRENKNRLSKKVYPEEMAELEPEKYWIDPRDGLCKERGEAQYFINENGQVNRVTKKEYLLRLRSLAHNPTSTKPIPPNKDNVSLARHDFEEPADVDKETNPFL